jgi:hypothetical protein
VIFAALALTAMPSMATAQVGTPEEQAACRPDVRRFCYKIPQSAGEKVFQACLEANREKLSMKCIHAMMEQKH